MRPIPMLQVVLRFALAGVMAHATRAIVVEDAPFSFAAVALGAMMCVAAIWLALGVHTRLVALLAIALYAAYSGTSPGTEATGRTGLFAALGIAAIAGPLVVFGGGRYRMMDDGRSDLA